MKATCFEESSFLHQALPEKFAGFGISRPFEKLSSYLQLVILAGIALYCRLSVLSIHNS